MKVWYIQRTITELGFENVDGIDVGYLQPDGEWLSQETARFFFSRDAAEQEEYDQLKPSANFTVTYDIVSEDRSN